jgi:hypothetical protein
MVRYDWPWRFTPAVTAPVPMLDTMPHGWLQPARNATNESLVTVAGQVSPASAMAWRTGSTSLGQSTPANP